MSTEVATQAKNEVATKKDIKSLLEGDAFKGAIASILPKHLTAERMARVAIACITRTPKLAECTKESFFGCMMTLSQLGIEPDGRRAHLIPYGNTCTLIIDYKGLVDLIMRTGNVSNIHADIVCKNDSFKYDCGEVKEHVIDFRKPRGDMYACYTIVTFKDGSKKSEVMSKDDVDAIRKRSRASGSGPWVTDYAEMAKKTVFKRCAKWIQLSSEVMDAIRHDDEQYEMPVYETPRDKSGLAASQAAASKASAEKNEPIDVTPEAEAAKPDATADDLPYT